MELFFLFAACVCLGLSSGYNTDVLYGRSHTFRVPSTSEYLVFRAASARQKTEVLWTRSKPEQTKRGQLSDRRFTMVKLTQMDSGSYTFRRKDNTTDGYGHYIEVISHDLTFNRMEGEDLHFALPLDQKCKLTFSPFDGESLKMANFEIGNQFYNRLDLPINDIDLSVSIRELQMRDSGVISVKDLQNNLAMVVNLTVTASSSIWVNVGIAAGVCMLVVFCCCCLKRCCCRKSSKSSDPDPKPAESPANLQQYSAEPSRPANPGYAYAYQPANLAPSAEMHSPASVPFTAPAAQVPAAKRQSDAPAVLSDSNFLSSDTNPQFVMKGMSLVAPLHSESTFAEVYTSDKLDFNFL